MVTDVLILLIAVFVSLAVAVGLVLIGYWMGRKTIIIDGTTGVRRETGFDPKEPMKDRTRIYHDTGINPFEEAAAKAREPERIPTFRKGDEDE